MCIKKTVNMKKDLKKEMVDYKISLLRDLYVQHQKPSTITVKKNAILKQMEELFNEVRGEILFSDGLTFFQKVQAIIFTADELNFIHTVEEQGLNLVYKKFDGVFYPSIYLKDLQESRDGDLKMAHQFRLKKCRSRSKKIVFVCPLD